MQKENQVSKNTSIFGTQRWINYTTIKIGWIIQSKCQKVLINDLSKASWKYALHMEVLNLNNILNPRRTKICQNEGNNKRLNERWNMKLNFKSSIQACMKLPTNQELAFNAFLITIEKSTFFSAILLTILISTTDHRIITKKN